MKDKGGADGARDCDVWSSYADFNCTNILIRMQDDPFPAAERILADIESIFQKDPKLKEFDILPVTLNQNKSPIHHVENCLGLELWCVRHVYCYVYRRLIDIRQQKTRRADPEVQCRLLMGALLLNPDVPTFWNMRRELLQACRLDCHTELHFTSVVLSRKPKCAEAFSYRKWIVTKLKLNGENEQNLLSEELRVARVAANRYANNYHAWQHCIWSLVHLAPVNSGFFEIYLEEWNATRAWATMHISDHSGWQYRQYLMQQLCGPVLDKVPVLDSDALLTYIDPILHCGVHVPGEFQQSSVTDSGEKKIVENHIEINMRNIVKQCSNTFLICSLSIILSELELSTDLITRYVGHEALWCHRRFLLTFLKSLLDKCSKCISSLYASAQSCCGNKSPLCFIQQIMFKYSLYIDELNSSCSVQAENSETFNCGSVIEKIKELLHHLNQALAWHEAQLLLSCVGSGSSQEKLSSQHRKWLKDILGVSFSV